MYIYIYVFMLYFFGFPFFAKVSSNGILDDSSWARSPSHGVVTTWRIRRKVFPCLVQYNPLKSSLSFIRQQLLTLLALMTELNISCVQNVVSRCPSFYLRGSATIQHRFGDVKSALSGSMQHFFPDHGFVGMSLGLDLT